jgi:hypothetical protein
MAKSKSNPLKYFNDKAWERQKKMQDGGQAYLRDSVELNNSIDQMKRYTSPYNKGNSNGVSSADAKTAADSAKAILPRWSEDDLKKMIGKK